LERIASLIVREHEAVGVFTMFSDARPLSPTVDALPRFVAPLGRLPLASTRLRRWLLPLYPRAVAQAAALLAREHRRRPIDLVISTSSAAIKGLRAPAGVPHVCYCHSPARYVWSQGAAYERGSALRGVGLRAFRASYRRWDARTAANVDVFLANSAHTRAQVRAAFGRDSILVFPPVDTDFYTPGDAPYHDARPAPPRDDRWLVVSALEPYKRIDLAIDAANRARHPLTVVGDGSSRTHLERGAGPTVRFTGRIPDEALRGLYRASRLLLFPQVEDFGIVAVEAQACGLPVVARRAGGALDIVRDGVTGALFGGDSTASLLEAVARCPAAGARACRVNAERFAPARFDAALRAVIAAAVSAKA